MSGAFQQDLADGLDERRALADVEAFQIRTVEMAIFWARSAGGWSWVWLECFGGCAEYTGDCASHAVFGECFGSGPMKRAAKIRMRMAALDQLA